MRIYYKVLLGLYIGTWFICTMAKIGTTLNVVTVRWWDPIIMSFLLFYPAYLGYKIGKEKR